MERIAWLGLGAMGRRMVRRLVDAGHEVTVWSRSGLPAQSPWLEGRLAESPRAAVRGATVVFSTVCDDEASRAVWCDEARGALLGVSPGALLVESSTLRPSWVAELGQRATAAGGLFLDAPVIGSRPQAEAGSLIYVVGGGADVLARARPVLERMGGAIHHLGPTPAGAIVKLLVNAFFGVQVALLAELLGAARGASLALAPLVEVLGSLPTTSPAAGAAARLMLSGQYAPLFPIGLAAKDLRYVLSLAEEPSLPLSQRAAEVFQRAVSQGLHAENIHAVAKLYDARPAR
jgi:3-hydroxyisobutyrate dehydrogenase